MAAGIRAGSAYIELTARGDRLLSDVTEQARRAGEAASATMAQTLSSGLSRAGSSLTSVGTTLSRNLTLPLVAAGTAVVKTSADFEYGMTRVKALSGATGEEFTQLRDQAKELGSTTKFSATDAADAMGFLAQAGFKTTEIMAAVPAILNGAAASGLELGRTADIVSNIMTGYGLQATEAARATDILVAAANAGNVDVDMLGESFKYGATTAKMASMTIEEATAAFTMLGNAGVQGSMGGTALSAALVQMMKPTGDAEKVMKKTGLSFADAGGKMKPLAQIIDEVGKAGLTNEQFITLFGVEGGRAMGVLQSQGGDAMRKLTADLEKSAGSTDAFAAIMSDTATNGMSNFSSAVEGLAIAIGDSGLLADFTKVVNVLGEFVGKLSSTDSSMLRMGTQIALVGVALGPVGIGLGKVAQGLGVFVSAGARVGSVAMAGARQLGMFASGFSSAGAAASSFSGPMGTLGGRVRTTMSAIGSGAASAATWLGSNLATAARTATTALGAGLSTAASATGRGLSAAGSGAASAASWLGSTLATAARTATTALGAGLSTAASATGRALSATGSAIASAASSMASYLTRARLVAAATRVWTIAQAAFNAVMAVNPFVWIVLGVAALVAGLVLAYNKVGWFRDFVDAAWSLIKDASIVAWAIVKGVVLGVWDAIGPKVMTVVQFIWTAIQVYWGLIQAYISAVMTVIQAVISVSWSVIQAVWSAAVAVVSTVVEAAFAVVRWVVETTMAAVQGTISVAWAVIQAIWSAAVAVVSTVVDAGFAVVRWVVETTMAAVQGTISGAWAVIQAVWSAAVAVLAPVVSAAFNVVSSVISTVMSACQAAISAAWSVIQSVWTTVTSAVSSATTSTFNASKSVVSTVMGAISSAVSAAWDAVTGAFNTVLGVVRSTMTNFVNAIHTAAQSPEKLVQAVRDMVSKAVSTVTELPGKVLSGIGDLGSLLYEKGKSLVQGLINGIKDMAGSLTSAVGGVVSKLNPFKSAPMPNPPAPAPAPRMADAAPMAAPMAFAAPASFAAFASPIAEAGSAVRTAILGGAQSFNAKSFDGLWGNPSREGLGSARAERLRPSITVNATTNASANDIAGEIAWQLRTSGR